MVCDRILGLFCGSTQVFASENAADLSGGVACAEYGIFDVASSRFESNRAGADGGVFLADSSRVRVSSVRARAPDVELRAKQEWDDWSMYMG